MTPLVLVDDHDLVRAAIRRLIEADGGIEVVGEASDGLRGVQVVLEQRPDLVLMDISLPKLSGIEATRQIKQALPGCKVLMLSQHDRPGYIQSALGAGASGYVLKTAAPRELKAALEAALQGECYLSPDVAQHVVGAFTRPRADDDMGLSALTGREREVLQLVSEGLSSKEIASQLRISVRTVDAHRSALMTKIGSRKVTGLVRFAIREGLIVP